ncbi:MAG: Cell division protein FtsA [Patescibacteria group bacterium]|nr:Cell division protein FtsA [Patescibacteria group bacterium]
MSKNITVGIDIGTQGIRVAIGELTKGSVWPHIIATGYAPTSGLRFGYIINEDEVIKSLKKAIGEAERQSGIRIRKASLSISSTGLSSEHGTGNAIISKADSEVTMLDISKAIDESEQSLSSVNKKILHTIPVKFLLDGKEIYGRPEGMKGIKLEVKTHFVTCIEQHIKSFIHVVSEAGVEVLDVVASPLASGAVTLSDQQKALGCILIDIGAETVSVGVFENGVMVSTHVFQIGSNVITSDIALGFRISPEEAEAIKVGVTPASFSKRKLDEIIEARLTDIFELNDRYLKQLRRSGLLPAGAILVGGGSQIPNIEQIARETLKFHAKIGGLEFFHNSQNKQKDASWMTAIGLCVVNHDNAYDPSGTSTLPEWWKNLKKQASNFIRQLLP